MALTQTEILEHLTFRVPSSVLTRIERVVIARRAEALAADEYHRNATTSAIAREALEKGLTTMENAPGSIRDAFNPARPQPPKR